MIPRGYITEWRANAPWVDDSQVEQDLVISRALLNIYSNKTLHDTLDPWLGEPAYKQSNARITYKYRFESEDGRPMRLKLEINTREHLTVEGLKEFPFAVDSRWHRGSCSIRTYELNELLGTKLRALYQRKKGRDLFDLAIALDHKDAVPRKIIESFHRYMDYGGNKVTRKQFEDNLAQKLKDKTFTDDIKPLLVSGYNWDANTMSEKVNKSLLSLIPG